MLLRALHALATGRGSLGFLVRTGLLLALAIWSLGAFGPARSWIERSH